MFVRESSEILFQTGDQGLNVKAQTRQPEKCSEPELLDAGPEPFPKVGSDCIASVPSASARTLCILHCP